MPENKEVPELWVCPLPDGNTATIEMLSSTNQGANNRLVIKLFTDGAIPVLEKELRELSEEEIRFLGPVGPGEGMSIEHCAYLGIKYEKQFIEKVCGYRTFPPTNPSAKVKVMFYEDTAPKI